MNIVQTAVFILILSLAVWAFFYMYGAPLTAPESLVVVGLCGIFTFVVRGAVRRLRRK